MNERTEKKLDSLAAAVHEWTESAVALDAGHFPGELLEELRDLITEIEEALEEDDSAPDDQTFVREVFVTPEMAEVIDRFPRVRRMLERAWGRQLLERIEEEASDVPPLDSQDEDEDEV